MTGPTIGGKPVAFIAERDCGKRHLGICWTERFARWSAHGAPPEYGHKSEWARLGPDGWKPIPCSAMTSMKGSPA